MEVQGKFNIKAPVERVWGSLWSEQTLPAWVPGCTSAHIDGNKIKAVVEQGVAFLKAKFNLEMDVVERQELTRVVLQGGGKDPNIASQVKLSMTLELEPGTDGTTNVSYKAEVQVFGRVATIGHFVIQAKAKEMDKELQARVKSVLESAA